MTESSLVHQLVPAAARPDAVGGLRPTLAARGGHGPLSFSLLAMLLGVVAGLGAFAFRALIALFHNLFFLGILSFRYDTNQHTPAGPWGYAVALVPAVGALAVVFLVKNFAPEAKGHGVPEVMDAIYYKKSIIRPVVAAIKSFASAISIGSGGSVGREGPIIQIGAAFASWLGQRSRVSRWQLATLVAAGGGAGIAATFNTPIGGLLFAVEVLMHEVSVRTLVPVAIATATATYVGQRLFGNTPAFPIPIAHASTAAGLLPAYVALGALMALVSVAFIRSLYGLEDFFEKWIPRHDYLRHIVGMLAVGVLAETLMVLYGHYYVEGVGYATILDVLSGTMTSFWMLLALFALKLAATSLTLGSGASGGVFSPSLFMGATIGGAYGVALRALIPGLGVQPASFALAGMAGLVGGATGAALTAVVMIFEMTLDYSVVLPMTLTVAVSYGLRRALCAQNIYTMKMVRRGHYMPEALQANAHLVHHVSDLHMTPAVVLSPTLPGACLDLDADGPQAQSEYVLMEGKRVAGILLRAWAVEHRDVVRDAQALDDVARHDFVVVGSNITFFELMAAIQTSGAQVAVVLSPTVTGGGEAGAVLGLLTKAQLFDALAESLELFAD